MERKNIGDDKKISAMSVVENEILIAVGVSLYSISTTSNELNYLFESPNRISSFYTNSSNFIF